MIDTLEKETKTRIGLMRTSQSSFCAVDRIRGPVIVQLHEGSKEGSLQSRMSANEKNGLNISIASECKLLRSETVSGFQTA